MSNRKVKVSDWLAANCQLKGCLHNDGHGTCTHQELDIIDEIADKLEKSGVEGLPEIEFFKCTEADFDLNTCELCGSEVCHHREYPTGEKQFLPVVYEVCSNKDCERSSI